MSIRFWSVRLAALPVFLLLSAGALALLAADRPDPPRVVEEIVAKVNGDIITHGDLEKAKILIEHDLRQNGLSGAALQQQYEKTVNDELRNQIDQLLLVQKGKELDINVEADL